MPRGRPKKQVDAVQVAEEAQPLLDAPSKQRWEYKDVLYGPITDDDASDNAATRLVASGYRLHTIYVIGGGTFEQQRRAVFEREVVNDG